MPYDVLLVAVNGAGCGKISRSERFFTREGGKMTHKCLDLLFARFVAPPFFLGVNSFMSARTTLLRYSCEGVKKL